MESKMVLLAFLVGAGSIVVAYAVFTFITNKKWRLVASAIVGMTITKIIMSAVIASAMANMH
jgi:hypothetical protein